MTVQTRNTSSRCLCLLFFQFNYKKDLPFFAEAMSSIIAIGLLGKLFQILSLQPFHEIYYDDTSVWTEEKSYTFAVSKTVCILSIGLLFSSVCAECTGPNIDILIFPLGLKTVSVPVSTFSFIVLNLY